ncbi:NADH-ubiquinone oxidoreductase-F iron-sulfur binding region domain-containing protein [Malikia sp.]|uniref:NADH-ubiquinone oxidoreductase-F iron-sulfur binding region domain-containing protein n=1 Tax=Malikia sp. TaxID=2070706 RepID=UPI002639EACE|nr:NADH-ubiquinone oxidoreductase-F iron-sulfur binding region domain-containing protein [Malikia sp.]MDD2730304.1 NADH-ubiquinone oxidoreductase-F iron-sulfur binding region domain-containing protein [Malikia sp.]
MPEPVPLPRRPRLAPKGRQVDPAARERVDRLCADLEPRADLLIEHLHRLQDADGGLRKGLLAALAERLRLSQAEVHEVATFHHHFDVDDDAAALPATTVRVCTSLSCAMAGGQSLLADLRQRLAGDPSVRVVEAPCIGQCHRAPAACVGQHQLPEASVGSVSAALAEGDTGPRLLPASGAPESPRDYAQFRRLLAGALTPEAVLAELKASGLRGLGGAGFPAWRKWDTVRAQPGPRYLVVNIDEGEVGTFKDWQLLSIQPRLALEGLLIAARVVGAEKAWIYLRDEYHDCRALLQDELAALGQRIAGWQAEFPQVLFPAIELRRGAGAYVCGEESALIESLEGRRGLPRLKPPIVALQGLFGRPTLVHNVETLSWLPAILEQGGAWLAGQGRRGRNGLRRFSVSGRVKHPGCYLAPAGITLRELIHEYAGGMTDGHQLQAYLPGGASGGILPAALAELPLDFDTLAEYGAFVGSMAVVVLSRQDRVREVATGLMRFFEHESCGQCTPCRAGTAQARALMQAPVWDAERLAELSHVMRDASICGLGQAAPNPFDSVLRFFPREVQP